MPAYLTLPMVLVLGGAILSAVGAFIVTVRQNQEKLQSATQRAEFESELRSKSDEIASLNREIAASVTGGDSFPIALYAPPIAQINDLNRLEVSILIEGKHPLLDVRFDHADITDPIPEKFDNAGEWNVLVSKMRLPALQGGTLHTKVLMPVGSIQVRLEDHYKKIRLTTFARNGTFIQITELKRNEDGRWEEHYKVSKEVPGHEPRLLKEE